jgi:hypothetical protein
MWAPLGSQLKKNDLTKFQQYLIALMQLPQIDIDILFVDACPNLLNDLWMCDLKLYWCTYLLGCDLFFC